MKFVSGFNFDLGEAAKLAEVIGGIVGGTPGVVLRVAAIVVRTADGHERALTEQETEAALRAATLGAAAGQAAYDAAKNAGRP